MTSAVAARTQPQPAPEPNTTPMPDPRRITEHDPRVAALRAAWRMKLTRSVGLLARSLRALPPHASAEPTLTAFIHGHVALLRAAYVDGHDLGATDYYHGVSRQPTSWARTVTTDDRQERRRLAFYAPSVAKMAHEALLAWQQDQAVRVHASEAETITLGAGYNPYRDPHGKFAPGPHAQRPGEGEGHAGGGGNSPGVRGTGAYLMRFTKRPHEDIQRGWTAASIQRYESSPPGEDPASAHAGASNNRRSVGHVVLDAVAQRSSRWDELAHQGERWQEELEQRKAEAQYYGHSFHPPANMEEDAEFIGRLADEWHLDARQMPSGEWLIYDHPGLAGFKVTSGARGSDAEPENDDEAARMALARRGEAWQEYRGLESGHSTVGRVHYVRDLGHNLHLFWAEQVVPEEDVRQQYREFPMRTLADETPSPLDTWQDDLGARLTLQADIMWSGLQDGYVAAGAGDAIGLYSLLYWILEPLAQHCDGCLMYAAGNPYNAPGLGGNTLDTAPGAGQTECGAACKCSLSYASPGEIDQPFWNAVFEQWQKAYAVGVAAQQQVAAPVPTDTAVKPQTPRRAPFTIPLEPLEPLTLPSDGGGGPLSDEQKSALDLYRATALAWEEWRGGLPPLPKLFADLDNPSPDVNAWLEAMPSWMALSPKQQQILAQVYEAVADWTLATAEAEIGRQQQGTDDGQNLTSFAERIAQRRLFHGYNPYRGPHGQFAPGPHAPREEEGEGGGRGGDVATKGSHGHIGRGNAGSKGRTKIAQPHESSLARVARARAVSRKEEAAQSAAKAKGHEEFLASHATAVARREGTAGSGPRGARTEAERELTLARLQQRGAERALASASVEHEAAKGHLQETQRNVNESMHTAQRDLHQRAIDDMLARSPETATRYAKVQAEAQRLRAIADAAGKAWEAHMELHGTSPGEGAMKELMRTETAAQRVESKQREMERSATNKVTWEHVMAHPSVVAAKAAHEQAVESLHNAEGRLHDAHANIEPWRVAEAQARVDKERGGSGFAIRDDGGKAQEHLQTIFGHKLSNEEIGGLVGALPGDHIHLEADTTYKGQPVVKITLHGAGFDPHREGDPTVDNGAYWASRHIERDENGKIVMYNDGNRQYEAGQGRGARIFGRQVAGLSKLGVDRIETNAAGSKHDLEYNGYYTWARFGYNAHFDPSEHGFTRAELPTGIRNARTLHGVMRTQEGRDWWRENGGGFGGVFNLHPGSVSMRVWSKYKRERGLKLSEQQQTSVRRPFARDVDWTDDDEQATNRAWDELHQELRQEEAAGMQPMQDDALNAARPRHEVIDA